MKNSDPIIAEVEGVVRRISHSKVIVLFPGRGEVNFPKEVIPAELAKYGTMLDWQVKERSDGTRYQNFVRRLRTTPFPTGEEEHRLKRIIDKLTE